MSGRGSKARLTNALVREKYVRAFAKRLRAIKTPVMGVKRTLELPGDDGAAQFDRQGFDGQVVPRLVDGMVEGYRRHFTPGCSVRRRERLPRVFVAPVGPFILRVDVARAHRQLSDIASQG